MAMASPRTAAVLFAFCIVIAAEPGQFNTGTNSSSKSAPATEERAANDTKKLQAPPAAGKFDCPTCPPCPACPALPACPPTLCPNPPPCATVAHPQQQQPPQPRPKGLHIPEIAAAVAPVAVAGTALCCRCSACPAPAVCKQTICPSFPPCPPAAPAPPPPAAASTNVLAVIGAIIGGIAGAVVFVGSIVSFLAWFRM